MKPTSVYRACFLSPVGPLEIKATESGIRSLSFAAGKPFQTSVDVPDCLKEAFTQLEEYFDGCRKKFSLELEAEGTDFQKKVWTELQKIPFGRTASYQDIARALGNIQSVRAVGAANGKNKIVIVVPCHRIIGKNGGLVGFGGGLWRKEWLLDHERKVLEGMR
jgi:methylated-DNA-[protein]-cysteine S-methyltransferase